MADNMTIELNNIRRDSDFGNGRVNKKDSVIVETFAALANGKTNVNDNAVKAIKEMAQKASEGDSHAASELNALRRFTIEPLLMEEIKLMGLFGTYKPLAWGDSIEREVYAHAGDKSRFQANAGDVVFPGIEKEIYPVAPVTISGGYAVDYRALANGDAQKENEGMEQVRRDIRNKASLYVVKTLYHAIKNATGVKYWAEASGISQASLDNIVKNVRRFGKTSIIGDYSVVSQINNFIGWSDGSSNYGVADAAMEEIRKNGLIGMYKGSVVKELENAFDLTQTAGSPLNFKTLLPEGLLFVLPTGVESPVMTWTRGGLTSMTGNDPATGKILTRFDLEVAADVAKGREFEIGLMNDTSLTPATEYNI